MRAMDDKLKIESYSCYIDLSNSIKQLTQISEDNARNLNTQPNIIIK